MRRMAQSTDMNQTSFPSTRQRLCMIFMGPSQTCRRPNSKIPWLSSLAAVYSWTAHYCYCPSELYQRKLLTPQCSSYNSFTPGLMNTFKVIDKKVHASRKRIITNAFSDRALKGMEEYFVSNIEKWCDAIKSVAGKEGLNMARTISISAKIINS